MAADIVIIRIIIIYTYTYYIKETIKQYFVKVVRY